MHARSKWFKSVKKTYCMFAPDIVTGLIIEKIAKESPAAVLGLEAGDVLLTFNGMHADMADIDSTLASGQGAEYLFYSPKGKTILKVKTGALPLGLRMISSSDSIVEKYKKQGDNGTDGYVALWEREDYSSLKQSIDVARKNPLAVKIFNKVLGRSEKSPISDLIQCIYDIEAGSGEEAFALLDQLAGAHDQDYPPNLQALIHYYKGLRAQMDNDWDGFETHMSSAHKYQSDSGRINKINEVANIETAGCSSMFGRMLPIHYEFSFLTGGHGKVDLQQILGNMSHGQVMPICFMPGARLSRTYDDALKIYRSVYPHVCDSLAPLVVITDVRKADKEKASEFKQEALAIDSGLPLVVLHENSGRFAADLELKTAPVFWALDKNGIVIWDTGLEDAYKYWDLRAAAMAPAAAPAQPYLYG